MPRKKTVAIRAPRGSVVKLRALSVSATAHQRLKLLVEEMERQALPRAHPSGAVDMLILRPEEALQLLKHAEHEVVEQTHTSSRERRGSYRPARNV
jgi:hypothetical protein